VEDLLGLFFLISSDHDNFTDYATGVLGIAHILIILDIPLEIELLMDRVSMPAKITGWYRLFFRDVSHISDVHISIHYHPRTTMILIGISLIFIFSSLVFSSTTLLKVIFMQGISILGSLVLRWFLELYMSMESIKRDTSIQGSYVGASNANLDICYNRVFAKSRLTLWLETAIAWAREKIPRVWTTIRTRRNKPSFWARRFVRQNVPRWARGRSQILDDYVDNGEYDLDIGDQLLASEYHDSDDV